MKHLRLDDFPVENQVATAVLSLDRHTPSTSLVVERSDEQILALAIHEITREIERKLLIALDVTEKLVQDVI